MTCLPLNSFSLLLPWGEGEGRGGGAAGAARGWHGEGRRSGSGHGQPRSPNAQLYSFQRVAQASQPLSRQKGDGGRARPPFLGFTVCGAARFMPVPV